MLSRRPLEHTGQTGAGRGTRWEPVVALTATAHARSGPPAGLNWPPAAPRTADVRWPPAPAIDRRTAVAHDVALAGTATCPTTAPPDAEPVRTAAVPWSATAVDAAWARAEPCAVYGEYAGDGAALGNGDVIPAGLLRLSEGGGRLTGTVDGASFQPPLSLLISSGGPAMDGVPFAIRLGG